MSNALERILSRLEQGDETITQKTAAEEETPEPSTEERLLATVRSITEGSEKTASASSEQKPANDLRKMAEQAKAAEEQVLTQKAASLGAALADGFMARFAQYDTALSDVEIKTASDVDTETMAKQAYAAARADLEKQAQDEYQRGFNDQLAEIQKTAAHYHLAGQQSARNVLDALNTKK